MNVMRKTLRGVGRTASRAATATTAAIGAVGGAAVNGALGGVAGTVAGVKRGLSTGNNPTPAAALAMGALGVTGLVDWPILLAVGGGALLLRTMNRQPEPAAPPTKAKLTTVPTTPTTVRKSTARRANSAKLHSTK